MISLVELFPALTEKCDGVPEFQEALIRIAWNYCVGERIRKISEPMAFQHQVLRVRVADFQWQSTLNSMKPEIVSKINTYLKFPLLRDIQVLRDQ
jgi:predicted nucleic acid-binding Zn ribbon protein